MHFNNIYIIIFILFLIIVKQSFYFKSFYVLKTVLRRVYIYFIYFITVKRYYNYKTISFNRLK
jgi:hypothetical protein